MDAGKPRHVVGNTLLLIALGLIAILEVAQLAGGSGVPAFAQDWAWPGDRAQIAPFIRSGLSPWISDGIGHPSVYPNPWWPFAFAGLLCYVLGVHYGVAACLFIAIFGAALGAAALAGALGCGLTGRLFAGFAFAANPVVLNEVHAGHWIYLFSYALMPAVALLALLPRSILGWWLPLGVIAGLSAAQLQFLPMNLFIACAFLALSTRAHKIRDSVLVCIAALVITSSQWVPGLAAAGPTYLDVQKPLPHWELSQSVRLSEAPRLLGYIGGFDRALLSDPTRAMWWWLPVFALAGIFVRRRSAVAWVLLSSMTFGIVTIAGIHGPAAPILGWLFVRVPAAAFFRELYHAAAIAAFSMTVLAAFAINFLWRNHRIAAMFACILAVIACSITAAQVSANIPRFVLDNDEEATVARVVSSTGSGRYLALPAVYPVAPSAVVLGGASPFLLPVASHPTLDAAVAEYPSAYAIALLRERHAAQAHSTLTSLGVSSIIRMPTWESAFERVLEPNLRGLVAPSGDDDLRNAPRFENVSSGERILIEPFEVSPHALPGTYQGEARDLRAVIGGDPIDIVDPSVSPNPKDAWARTTLWPVLPAWALAQPPGVFTLRASARLPVPASIVVAGSADGPPHSGVCSLRARLAGNFAALACGANPVLAGSPPLVVSSATRDGNLQAALAATGERGVVAVDSASPWEVRAHVTAVSGSAIVLRERFDPSWDVSIPGARHVLVDGYANGWVLSERFTSEPIVIRYRGATIFLALLWFSQSTLALTVAVVAGTFISVRRRQATSKPTL